MSKSMKYLAFTLLVASLGSLCSAKDYPYRWVYVSRSLHSDADVRDITSIARTASEHGLNGMVLAAGFDRLDLQPEHYFTRLEKVKKVCADIGIEIIPQVFSAGYGGSILSHDRNLAAGIPVADVPFIVEDGMARFVPDLSVKIKNGDLEEYEGNRLAAFNFHDRPGDVSFVDTNVFSSGKACLRFENFGKYEHGHARLMQQIRVRPHRCYRFSCSVKTDSLAPAGAFRMLVLASDGRNLAPFDPGVPPTTDWRQVTMGFNSLEYDTVRIYVGAWGGRSGRFWIDDLRVEEVTLLNLLRRPGTPVAVKDAKTGMLYEEGKDFAPIKDPQLNFRFDHEPPAIRILPEGRIRDGDRLAISYYHGIGVNRGQVTICMSEPKVYDIWRNQVRLIHKHLAAGKYMLSMDEIRAGGACRACKGRNMTMGQILGDCITKQHAMIREVNGEAEVFIWSDMLDPNHNAHGNYYLVDGDFTGSWKFVPKDLVIVCWYYGKRNQSLPFFSSLGFRTLAGAYYDGDTLDNPKGWLQALAQTPNACGIMYTTWQNKYALLGPFGDLVAGKAGQ
jgi:hypothetical protein